MLYETSHRCRVNVLLTQTFLTSFYNFTGNEETVNLPSDNALAEGDRKNHEIPPPEPAPVSTPKPLERPPSPHNSEVVKVEDTVEHEEKAKFLDNVQVNLCV